MPDLPIFALFLVLTGFGYIAIALGMTERPQPEAVVLTVADTAEDDLVLEWTGEQFEMDPSTPRLDVTV